LTADGGGRTPLRGRSSTRLLALALVVASGVAGATPGSFAFSSGATPGPASLDLPGGTALAPAAPGPLGALPPPNWHNLSTTPTGAAPASSGTLVYDAADGYTLWIGGYARNDSVVQTWRYLGGTWTNLTAGLATAPPSSEGSVATYDATDADVVLAVGHGGPQELTWSFSGGGWTNVTDPNATAPPPRQLPAFAYSPSCGCVVLFGGLGPAGDLADTWTLTGGNWTRTSPTPSPGARDAAGFAFDTPLNALVLVGGVDAAGPRTDTWTFASGTWTAVALARAPAGMAAGPNAVAPVPGGPVVGFGGTGCGAGSLGLCNRTYEFAGGNWTAIASASAPSPRPAMELAYDGADGYVIGWGGGLPGEVSDETWALGGPLVARLTFDPPVVQAPNATRFVTTASGGYGVYSYVYAFTDANGDVICQSQNLSSFLCPLDLDDVGNRTLQVTVLDGAGNSTVAPGYFIALPPFTAALVLSTTAVDVGLPFTASIATPTYYPGVNFTWYGLPPDCGAITVGTFTCTTSLPGSYPISCEAVDSIGTRELTATVYLQVHTDPVVGAWPSRLTGPAPLTVEFTSSVAGGTGPYNATWSFGDGTTGAGTSVTHTFLAEGQYAVAVNVTDAAGWTTTAALALPVTVGAPLVASIGAPSQFGNAPTSVVFVGSASGGLSPYDYRWTLPSGINESGPQVSVAVPVAGTYRVTLTVVDAAGSSTQTSTVFTVAPAPSDTGAGNGTPSLVYTIGIPLVAAIAGIGVGWFLRRRPRRPPPPTVIEPKYPERP